MLIINRIKETKKRKNFGAFEANTGHLSQALLTFSNLYLKQSLMKQKFKSLLKDTQELWALIFFFFIFSILFLKYG